MSANQPVKPNVDLSKSFENLDDNTKNIFRAHKHLLAPVIAAMMKDVDKLVPHPHLIFRAFELCPIEKVRVILIGQDPYTNNRDACGLSFSVPKGVAMPRSLINIAKCLENTCGEKLSDGDLTHWARQGVLMLNMALTTTLGVSRAHTCWHQFTQAIIRHISETNPDVCAILLGGDAQTLAGHFRRTFVWGHPSPMNSANKQPGPNNFINCDVFARVNQFLNPPIKWGTPVDAPPLQQTLLAAVVDRDAVSKQPGAPDIGENSSANQCPYKDHDIVIVADGGALSNGSKKCVAAAAWIVLRNGTRIAQDCSLVDSKIMHATNNRAELTAILSALTWVLNTLSNEEKRKQILVVSDSNYCIKALTEQYPKWIRLGKLAEKKNIDLISKIYDIQLNVAYKHVYGHQSPNQYASDSVERFFISNQCYVDRLCSEKLNSSP